MVKPTVELVVQHVLGVFTDGHAFFEGQIPAVNFAISERCTLVTLGPFLLPFPKAPFPSIAVDQAAGILMKVLRKGPDC